MGFNVARSSTNEVEAMRIDDLGNLLIGKTNTQLGNGGIMLRPVDGSAFTRSSGPALNLNRLSTDGEIIGLYKAGTLAASIGAVTISSSVYPYIAGNFGGGVLVGGITLAPTNGSGALSDNAMDLGGSSYRWKVVYAGTGTINTSDRREKRDIAELDEAERRVAVACKGLLRKFRFNDSYEEKGEDARIHFGIIAQDLQAAFEAEGLDAGRYGMFIHSTGTDELTGKEVDTMGVRYSELLAFIIAAL